MKWPGVALVLLSSVSTLDAFSPSPRLHHLSSTHQHRQQRLRESSFVQQVSSGSALFVARSVTPVSEKTFPDDEEDENKSLFKDTSNKSITTSNNNSNRNSNNNNSSGERVSRFRRLKDFMWIRETLEDLAAAEFACSVEAVEQLEGEEDSRKRRRRAVDYEKLMGLLDARIIDMVGSGRRPHTDIPSQPELDEDRGMGRVIYSLEERNQLLGRIIQTRNALVASIRRNNFEIAAGEDDGSTFNIKLPAIPEIRVEIPKEESTIAPSGPKLYVRDDGTVDWEGALQDRDALKKLGGAVWQRINGRTPTSISDEETEGGSQTGEKASSVMAKIQDTPEIIAARDELNRLSDELAQMQRDQTTLLTSGIRTGQAVANVKLASLNPDLRNKIRESTEALHSLEQKVEFQTLVYELERIYTYLVTELGNPDSTGYVPLQDRLNVAEYGLLESQMESFHRELERKKSIDEDILAVVMEQLTDFKRRLGIDYYVTGLTFDREAIILWLNDIARKTKSGAGFYVKGCQLFWDDVVYSSGLIARAAQGYTLKPREVRTIRRTFKDIITFIPVVIILIIPMTPIGHVLVFGAIQRFFPDFFPSCFTEQRQNLLKLYETTEFSEFTINESPQEKFVRILEAIGFFFVSGSRELYEEITGQKAKPANKLDDKTDQRSLK